MPGPTPKPAALRQRRNKESTAASLSLVAHDIETPELPALIRATDDGGLEEIEWHPRTIAWWDTIWSSPMAPEWLQADWEGLYLLAELEDDFHRAGTARERIELLKEIRLQRAEFGLTPIARRRLQWEVARGEEAADATAKRRAPRPVTVTDHGPVDPLAGLR